MYLTTQPVRLSPGVFDATRSIIDSYEGPSSIWNLLLTYCAPLITVPYEELTTASSGLLQRRKPSISWVTSVFLLSNRSATTGQRRILPLGVTLLRKVRPMLMPTASSHFHLSSTSFSTSNSWSCVSLRFMVSPQGTWR